MAKSSKPSGDIPVSNLEDAALETLAVRAGQIRSHELEHSEAIFPTSSFVFNSAEQAAKRFAGDDPGNIYARFTNPTVSMFEARIAALEGAERAVAAASGMAAIMAVCMAFLRQGDHLVCSKSVFGTTTVFLENFMRKFGVEMSFVAIDDYQAWQDAIKSNTRFMYLESPSNPLCEVADIKRLAEIAKTGQHEAGCLLLVDNCFCTPVFQQPLALGADIVIHSATKYLDGQGRCLGGVVAGRGELLEAVHSFIRSGGATMSPFNAWVFLKGLETLRLRMRAHAESAMQIATWLQAHPSVERVFYTGLPAHPQKALIDKQQSGYSGVLSFRIKGAREQAWAFIDGIEMLSITANLGDAKTTITHPATTTHGRLSDEAKLSSGITENLIRLSIGLESPSDIIRDLERGFASAKAF